VVAILNNWPDQRTQFWKGTTQGVFGFIPSTGSGNFQRFQIFQPFRRHLGCRARSLDSFERGPFKFGSVVLDTVYPTSQPTSNQFNWLFLVCICNLIMSDTIMRVFVWLLHLYFVFLLITPQSEKYIAIHQITSEVQNVWM
jgi:hypothetical protein